MSSVLAPVREDLDHTAHRVAVLARDAARSLAGPAEAASSRPGKMVRPALVLLAALAGREDYRTGRAKTRRRLLAAASAFELLHLASLIHDDIIDGSDVRRGRPAVWKGWGLDSALLVGDHLYGKAMAQASLAGYRACRSLCRVIGALIEGQVLEMRAACGRRAYRAMATAKTAVFAAECCRLGAVLTGAGRARVRALRGYGLALGQAYQFVDDLLDWVGDPAETGKPLFRDVAAGRRTLPLIIGLARRPIRVGRLLAEVENLAAAGGVDGEATLIRDLASELETAGAFEETRALARAASDRAKAWLRVLPAGPPADNLEGLAQILLDRRV